MQITQEQAQYARARLAGLARLLALLLVLLVVFGWLGFWLTPEELPKSFMQLGWLDWLQRSLLILLLAAGFWGLAYAVNHGARWALGLNAGLHLLCKLGPVVWLLQQAISIPDFYRHSLATGAKVSWLVALLLLLILLGSHLSFKLVRSLVFSLIVTKNLLRRTT